MKPHKLPVVKQVYLILGVIGFAFFNVFLFDDKVGIGFSVFSTLILLTIGLLSRQKGLRILGMVSYLINVISALFGFSYLGWLTAVQLIQLIFVIYYIYAQERLGRTDQTSKAIRTYRWQQLFWLCLTIFGVYLGYLLISAMWNGSFLEYGGNTVFIFGVQYFLYTALQKIRANEADAVVKIEERYETLAKVKDKSKALDNFIKIAAIWLLVMDLSILSYVIKPNDIGFGIGAFFVLISIIISLLVQTVEDTEDVFSVIYHKIRPVQPIFFMILLIARAHQFSYGAAYASIFAVVYFIWALNKINMKTLLTVTTMIYFLPVVGYISNPFRLGATNLSEAIAMVTEKGATHFFDVNSWFLTTTFNQYEEMHSYTEKVTVDYDEFVSVEAGLVVDDSPELTIDYNLLDDIEITAETTYDELTLDGLVFQYNNGNPLDIDDGYYDYYHVGDVEGKYGSYRIFLKMTDDWIKDYQEDKRSVTYDFLILGEDVSLPDAIYEEY